MRIAPAYEPAAPETPISVGMAGGVPLHVATESMPDWHSNVVWSRSAVAEWSDLERKESRRVEQRRERQIPRVGAVACHAGANGAIATGERNSRLLASRGKGQTGRGGGRALPLLGNNLARLRGGGEGGTGY